MSENLKRTPLYEDHVRLGARIVPFAGWEMPIEFEGLRAEHHCVRNQVGLFDVSHMGEIWVRGPKSLETLQWLTSNDVAQLKPGRAQYTLLLNHQGGVVDDVIVYCIRENDEYMVCVNAANTEKDYAWMLENNRGADIQNESENWGQIAIQGPHARPLMVQIFPQAKEMKAFDFQLTEYQGTKAIIACTGYTGEDGFEVFVAKDKTLAFWRELLQKGESFGVKPIGLGARDTLRTEMKYSLYGHEITDKTNPLEAGLGWVVKLNKGDFIGREAVAQSKSQGLQNKLIGFKMLQKGGFPRAEYSILNSEGQKIGFVTSGTLSPTLNEGIGIGYVSKEFGQEGSEIYIDIRGRSVKAQVVKTPFVPAKTI